MAWIFQQIKDIKDDVLYGNMSSGKSTAESIRLYNEALRRKVRPELYVRYCIWQCDVYVDVPMIQVATCNVYPDVSHDQVAAWCEQHKEENQYLTY